jgi:hypothetical protein
LECFCSSEFDFEFTDQWLERLKQQKTMPALYFNQETCLFEDVVLIDEDTKK